MTEYQKNVRNEIKHLVIIESKEVIKVRSKGFRNHLKEAPTGRVWTFCINGYNRSRLKYIK